MDDLTRTELEQLLAVFRDQSLQILEEMGSDLIALESGRGDDEAMTRLRRGAHTIKGDSACVDLDGVTRVAHKIEDVFDAVLRGQVKFDRRSVNVILKSLDAIKTAIGGAEVSDIAVNAANGLVEALTATEKSAIRDASFPKRFQEKCPGQPTASRTVNVKQTRGFVRLKQKDRHIVEPGRRDGDARSIDPLDRAGIGCPANEMVTGSAGQQPDGSYRRVTKKRVKCEWSLRSRFSQIASAGCASSRLRSGKKQSFREEGKEVEQSAVHILPSRC